MFLEIVFCFFLLVIGSNFGSAQDPCSSALSAHKEIRDKLSVYEDKNYHCFFRLSAADETASAPVVPETDDAKAWVWDKYKAVRGCTKYSAFLPRLKDPKITEFFWKAANRTLKTKSAILLGLNMGPYSTMYPPNGSPLDVTWDDDTLQKLDFEKIYGQYKFTLPNKTWDVDKPCYGNVDLDSSDGSWACTEPASSNWAPVVFCQVTYSKAPTNV